MMYVYRLPNGEIAPVTVNPKPAGRVIVRIPLADYRAMQEKRASLARVHP